MIRLFSKILLTGIAAFSLFLLFYKPAPPVVVKQQTVAPIPIPARINPLPYVRALITGKHYVSAVQYLDFFRQFSYVRKNPAATAMYRQLEEKRASWSYKLQKIGEGIWTGKSDEDIGRTAGKVSDFLIVGDIRDVITEGMHYVQGEDADPVVAGLATLSLISSGAEIVSAVGSIGTGGASAPVAVESTVIKNGISTLKIARKLGRLPNWLSKAIIQTAQDYRDSGKFEKIKRIVNLVNNLNDIQGGLALLAQTHDTESLRRNSELAQWYQNNAVMLYRIGGEQALDIAYKNGPGGKNDVLLAATYGSGGLQLLQKYGREGFRKILRQSQKPPAPVPSVQKPGKLHSFLLKTAAIPRLLLILTVMLGAAVWLPWRAGFMMVRNRFAAADTPFYAVSDTRRQLALSENTREYSVIDTFRDKLPPHFAIITALTILILIAVAAAVKLPYYIGLPLFLLTLGGITGWLWYTDRLPIIRK